MISEENSASKPNVSEHSHAENVYPSDQEPRLALTQDINNLRQEHDHLRQRVNTLTGVLLSAGLLVIVSLTWMIYQMQTQAKIVQKLDMVSESTELVDRLTDVEQQLVLLSAKLPDNLVADVQANREQIASIAEQLRQVEANEQNLQSLIEAVRDVTGRQIVPVTPAQPEPAQPEPVQSEQSNIDGSEESSTP